MGTKRGSTVTHRRVVWEGDVLAGTFANAWKDVSHARGKGKAAPATRFVRMNLSDAQIDLACFNGELLLHTSIATSNVTSNDARQIAVDDPLHQLADLVRGMITDGGHCHLTLMSGTQGEAQEMWLADEMLVEWGKHAARLPVSDQIAEADWQSIPALIALRKAPVKVGRIVDMPGLNSALASLGKPVTKTHYGENLPWSLEAEGVAGAILGTVFAVKSPVDTEEGKALEARAFGFLDSLRKPPPAGGDDRDGDDEGPQPIPGDQPIIDPDTIADPDDTVEPGWEDPPNPAIHDTDDAEVVE